jgi:hypothetical protein
VTPAASEAFAAVASATEIWFGGSGALHEVHDVVTG